MAKFEIGEIVFNFTLSTPNKGIVESKFISSTGELKYIFRRLKTDDYFVVDEDQISRMKFNPKSQEYLDHMNQLIEN